MINVDMHKVYLVIGTAYVLLKQFAFIEPKWGLMISC